MKTETRLSAIDAQGKFYRSLGLVPDETGSGKNDTVHAFMRGTMMILTNFRSHSFTINDLFNLLRSVETNAVRVNELWLKWTKLMVELGIIEKIPGCYNDDLFVLV